MITGAPPANHGAQKHHQQVAESKSTVTHVIPRSSNTRKRTSRASQPSQHLPVQQATSVRPIEAVQKAVEAVRKRAEHARRKVEWDEAQYAACKALQLEGGAEDLQVEMSEVELAATTSNFAAQFPPGWVQLEAVQASLTDIPQHYIIAVGGNALYVAFMGTKQPRDVVTDAQLLKEPVWAEAVALAANKQSIPAAHSGFLQRARSINVEHLYELAVATGRKRLVLCGHSLGGAVAKLCTLRLLRELPEWPTPRLRCICFATPSVGNSALADFVVSAGWAKYFKTYFLPEDQLMRLASFAQLWPGGSPAAVAAASAAASPAAGAKVVALANSSASSGATVQGAAAAATAAASAAPPPPLAGKATDATLEPPQSPTSTLDLASEEEDALEEILAPAPNLGGSSRQPADRPTTMFGAPDSPAALASHSPPVNASAPPSKDQQQQLRQHKQHKQHKQHQQRSFNLAMAFALQRKRTMRQLQKLAQQAQLPITVSSSFGFHAFGEQMFICHEGVFTAEQMQERLAKVDTSSQAQDGDPTYGIKGFFSFHRMISYRFRSLDLIRRAAKLKHDLGAVWRMGSATRVAISDMLHPRINVDKAAARLPLLLPQLPAATALKSVDVPGQSALGPTVQPFNQPQPPGPWIQGSNAPNPCWVAVKAEAFVPPRPAPGGLLANFWPTRGAKATEESTSLFVQVEGHNLQYARYVSAKLNGTITVPTEVVQVFYAQPYTSLPNPQPLHPLSLLQNSLHQFAGSIGRLLTKPQHTAAGLGSGTVDSNSTLHTQSHMVVKLTLPKSSLDLLLAQAQQLTAAADRPAAGRLPARPSRRRAATAAAAAAAVTVAATSASSSKAEQSLTLYVRSDFHEVAVPVQLFPHRAAIVGTSRQAAAILHSVLTAPLPAAAPAAAAAAELQPWWWPQPVRWLEGLRTQATNVMQRGVSVPQVPFIAPNSMGAPAAAPAGVPAAPAAPAASAAPAATAAIAAAGQAGTPAAVAGSISGNFGSPQQVVRQAVAAAPAASAAPAAPTSDATPVATAPLPVLTAQPGTMPPRTRPAQQSLATARQQRQQHQQQQLIPGTRLFLAVGAIGQVTMELIHQRRVLGILSMGATALASLTSAKTHSPSSQQRQPAVITAQTVVSPASSDAAGSAVGPSGLQNRQQSHQSRGAAGSRRGSSRPRVSKAGSTNAQPLTGAYQARLAMLRQLLGASAASQSAAAPAAAAAATVIETLSAHTEMRGSDMAADAVGATDALPASTRHVQLTQSAPVPSENWDTVSTQHAASSTSGVAAASAGPASGAAAAAPASQAAQSPAAASEVSKGTEAHSPRPSSSHDGSGGSSSGLSLGLPPLRRGLLLPSLPFQANKPQSAARLQQPAEQQHQQQLQQGSSAAAAASSAALQQRPPFWGFASSLRQLMGRDNPPEHAATSSTMSSAACDGPLSHSRTKTKEPGANATANKANRAGISSAAPGLRNRLRKPAAAAVAAAAAPVAFMGGIAFHNLMACVPDASPYVLLRALAAVLRRQGAQQSWWRWMLGGLVQLVRPVSLVHMYNFIRGLPFWWMQVVHRAADLSLQQNWSALLIAVRVSDDLQLLRSRDFATLVARAESAHVPVLPVLLTSPQVAEQQQVAVLETLSRACKVSPASVHIIAVEDSVLSAASPAHAAAQAPSSASTAQLQLNSVDGLHQLHAVLHSLLTGPMDVAAAGVAPSSEAAGAGRSKPFLMSKL